VAILAIVYVAINRYGVRLPLKPFFAVTSAFLYYTAFVFAGKGIAELQAGGVVGTTMLPSGPRLPALGIYPTVESLAAQALLLLLAAAALFWVFVGSRLTAAVPGAEAVAVGAAPLRVTSVDDGPGMEKAVLRSLEQMEGDLAALKDEVQRLRATVVESTADEVSRES
jgi:hypothetical protein